MRLVSPKPPELGTKVEATQGRFGCHARRNQKAQVLGVCLGVVEWLFFRAGLR